MHDMKAAAKRIRDEADFLSSHISTVWHSTKVLAELESRRDHHLLAAQALEAWAWQQETGASVRQTTGGEFWCAVKLQGHQITNNYYADTPLGAVLAAMEGEGNES